MVSKRTECQVVDSTVAAGLSMREIAGALQRWLFLLNAEPWHGVPELHVSSAKSDRAHTQYRQKRRGVPHTAPAAHLNKACVALLRRGSMPLSMQGAPILVL